MYIPMLKIKFIDSLSFIPMRQADFPKPLAWVNWQRDIFPTCLTRRKIKIILDPYHRVPIITPTEWVWWKEKSLWSGTMV
jgi:hypothetical protein